MNSPVPEEKRRTPPKRWVFSLCVYERDRTKKKKAQKPGDRGSGRHGGPILWQGDPPQLEGVCTHVSLESVGLLWCASPCTHQTSFEEDLAEVGESHPNPMNERHWVFLEANVAAATPAAPH